MSISIQITAEKRKSINALLDGNDKQCERSADRLSHLYAVGAGEKCPECGGRKCATNGFNTEAQCSECGGAWEIG